MRLDPSSGNATFLFTDIEGSTKLTRELTQGYTRACWPINWPPGFVKREGPPGGGPSLVGRAEDYLISAKTAACAISVPPFQTRRIP